VSGDIDLEQVQQLLSRHPVGLGEADEVAVPLAVALALSAEVKLDRALSRCGHVRPAVFHVGLTRQPQGHGAIVVVLNASDVSQAAVQGSPNEVAAGLQPA
jgi:hypothetical protein